MRVTSDQWPVITDEQPACESKGVGPYWPPVIGHWLLATGYWPLATGYWPLATGYWPLATGHWLLATGYWAGGWFLSLFHAHHRSTMPWT